MPGVHAFVNVEMLSSPKCLSATFFGAGERAGRVWQVNTGVSLEMGFALNSTRTSLIWLRPTRSRTLVAPRRNWGTDLLELSDTGPTAALHTSTRDVNCLGQLIDWPKRSEKPVRFVQTGERSV